MRILSDRNVIKCDCGCVFEYETFDVAVLEENMSYVKCPKCKHLIDVDKPNVHEYPKEFHSVKGGVSISNKEINRWIDEALISLASSGEEYTFHASGNTIVATFDVGDEYDIYVCKDYQELTIPKELV